jgi:hypothetical protein
MMGTLAQRNSTTAPVGEVTLELTSKVSYDIIREHSFFTKWELEYSTLQSQFYGKMEIDQINSEYLSSSDAFINVEYTRNIYKIAEQGGISSIQSLHDICLRAVGEAAISVAFHTADNGGIRPDIPWIKKFILHDNVSFVDRERIMHYLERKQKLHIPGIHRLFYKTLPQSRCIRANPNSLDYVGMNRDLQGRHELDFFYIIISNPRVGAEGDTNGNELKQRVTQINKIRPKFVVVTGNFVDSYDENYEANVDVFRKCIARISDTINVLFVPGPEDLAYCNLQVRNNSIPFECFLSKDSVDRYRCYFGADYYSFWYQGMKGIVINSSLFIADNFSRNVADENTKEFIFSEVQRQLVWLIEEIEQSKLCATSIVIFSYHPFFFRSINEEDNFESGCIFPESIRQRLLKLLRHHKVKYCFCSLESVSNSPLRPFTLTATATDAVVDSVDNDESIEVDSEEINVANKAGDKNDENEPVSQNTNAENSDEVSESDLFMIFNI